ncbi:MAG TPA: replicative DNA helicase [Zoogloea sp.]|uniref:replicative DNA helicase n=1 Tax=Zoogloea sp. TaxID=49181 RepID=UPI002BA85ABA|nr:replicative DNA helicase [Zoogloea sp.]HMV17876.1 replicative DNA helicase [Rhodocyclaceae bacterium]HMV64997.1 replicative DNA helicase [Rhodocyclaceae bacterium]HMW53691.1 replicative DNA helicase [Rhodocyclaceae bacterium]HMY50412.1 replicative DNA helicase [Rhodocyclaceae bacterium]HMZ76773.1 replicative DNA helicase [Rhodocyclaceae bacterium]
MRNASLSEDPALASLRLPPHSLEAEQSLLGGLLIDNTVWDRVGDIVSEVDFYRDDHRRIFRQIAKLIELGKPADVVTVYEALEKAGEAEHVGGLAYLGEIANSTPSAANVRRYGEIVRERAILRKLVAVGDQIAASALAPSGKDAKTLLDEAEAKVFEIAEAGARTTTGFVPIQPLLGQVVDRIQELYDRDSPSGITGVATGLTDLDEKTSGLQPSDMIVVAGRPGMGKTSFALNIAENVAVECGLPVAVFSMEMPGTQLATRFLSSVGRLDQHRVRTGKLTDEEWQRLTFALGKLHEAPIYIDETPGLNPTDLRARCRRLHRQCGRLGLIVIDYLQLMTSLKESDNRAAELSEISRSVKSLAKELHVPIIALSQLNRSLEQRPNKRPVMSDLRESGAIEQDADIIMFIYRDEIYNPDSQDKGTAELIVAKHRNGSTGTIRMTFIGEYTRFENYVGGAAVAEY